jgi:hypothetical protein
MKSLCSLIMITIWILVISGCTPRLDSNGCYGYWYDPGLKRGTLLKNQNYVSPYRQCVEHKAPHKNLEKRPNG